MSARTGDKSALQTAIDAMRSRRSHSNSITCVATNQRKVAAAQYELRMNRAGGTSASQAATQWPPCVFAASIEASTGGKRVEMPAFRTIQTNNGMIMPLTDQIMNWRRLKKLSSTSWRSQNRRLTRTNTTRTAEAMMKAMMVMTTAWDKF